jgi:hypothetical protein
MCIYVHICAWRVSLHLFIHTFLLSKL